jgi:hypothetical protein
MVAMNKCFLFFSLTILLIIVSQSMFIHLSKQWIRCLVLFLFFDIFIDETVICIPLCKLLDTIVSEDSSYFKMNMSLCIEMTDNPEIELSPFSCCCSSLCQQKKNICVKQENIVSETPVVTETNDVDKSPVDDENVDDKKNVVVS